MFRESYSDSLQNIYSQECHNFYNLCRENSMDEKYSSNIADIIKNYLNETRSYKIIQYVSLKKLYMESLNNRVSEFILEYNFSVNILASNTLQKQKDVPHKTFLLFVRGQTEVVKLFQSKLEGYKKALKETRENISKEIKGINNLYHKYSYEEEDDDKFDKKDAPAWNYKVNEDHEQNDKNYTDIESEEETNEVILTTEENEEDLDKESEESGDCEKCGDGEEGGDDEDGGDDKEEGDGEEGGDGDEYCDGDEDCDGEEGGDAEEGGGGDEDSDGEEDGNGKADEEESSTTKDKNSSSEDEELPSDEIEVYAVSKNNKSKEGVVPKRIKTLAAKLRNYFDMSTSLSSVDKEIHTSFIDDLIPPPEAFKDQSENKAEVRKNTGKTEVKKDISKTEVKKDISKTEVKKDISKTEVKKDISKTEVKKDVGKKQVKNDTEEKQVKKDIGKTEDSQLPASKKRRNKKHKTRSENPESEEENSMKKLKEQLYDKKYGQLLQEMKKSVPSGTSSHSVRGPEKVGQIGCKSFPDVSESTSNSPQSISTQPIVKQEIINKTVSETVAEMNLVDSKGNKKEELKVLDPGTSHEEPDQEVDVKEKRLAEGKKFLEKMRGYIVIAEEALEKNKAFIAKQTKTIATMKEAFDEVKESFENAIKNLEICSHSSGRVSKYEDPESTRQND